MLQNDIPAGIQFATMDEPSERTWAMANGRQFLCIYGHWHIWFGELDVVAINEVSGEVRDIDISTRHCPDEVLARRVIDAGFPPRTSIGPLTHADLDLMQAQRLAAE